MITCGQEQPIRPNTMIKAAPQGGDDFITIYTSSIFADPRLNRYSFVWLGYDVSKGYDVNDATSAFSSLLRGILSTWDVELTAVWRGRFFSEGTAMQWWTKQLAGEMAMHQERANRGNLLSQNLLQGDKFQLSEAELVQRGREAEEKTQARLIHLRREGWDTYHRGNLAVATKQINISNYRYDDSLWSFLTLGPTPPARAFTRMSLRSTMQAFPYFAPNGPFLKWLATQSFSIVYQQKDTLDRPGVVIVGSHPIDTACLLRNRSIRRVETDYEHAWLYPPHPESFSHSRD